MVKLIKSGGLLLIRIYVLSESVLYKGVLDFSRQCRSTVFLNDSHKANLRFESSVNSEDSKTLSEKSSKAQSFESSVNSEDSKTC